MKIIDQEYENFSYSGDRWFSFQSKLSAYRKEIEAQTQEEMNTKVCFLQSNGMKSAPSRAAYFVLDALSYISCLLCVLANLSFVSSDATF